MKKIESLDNPLVKKVVQLHTPKGRKTYQLAIAEGERVCVTIAESALEIVHIFVTHAFLEKYPNWSDNALCITVSEKIFAKMSASVSPSGILIVFKITNGSKKLTSAAVLSHVSDPGNMGTLIRSASAFGYESCVIIGGADVWSPKVVQASAGMCAHMNIVTMTFEELIAAKGTLQLTGLIVKEGTPIAQVKKNDHRLILIGSEAHGLSDQEKAACDELVTIPMQGHTESLNAAIAGSLALYLLKTS